MYEDPRWLEYYYWELQHTFIERWKYDMDQQRLLFLAEVYSEVECFGTRYPSELMEEVSNLAHWTPRPWDPRVNQPIPNKRTRPVGKKKQKPKPKPIKRPTAAKTIETINKNALIETNSLIDVKADEDEKKMKKTSPNETRAPLHAKLSVTTDSATSSTTTISTSSVSFFTSNVASTSTVVNGKDNNPEPMNVDPPEFTFSPRMPPKKRKSSILKTPESAKRIKIAVPPSGAIKNSSSPSKTTVPKAFTPLRQPRLFSSITSVPPHQNAPQATTLLTAPIASKSLVTAPEPPTNTSKPLESKKLVLPVETPTVTTVSMCQSATQETTSAMEPRESQDLKDNKQAMQTKRTFKVVITTDPPTKFTNEQSDIIIEYLQQKIIYASKNCTFVPRFRGKPNLLNTGVLCIWCEDEDTLQWLEATVQDLPKPQEGKYTVVRHSEVEIKVRSGILLPGKSVSNAKLALQLLSHQNSWCHVEKWKLYKSTLRNNGLFLILWLPLSEVSKILSKERRLCYLMGSVYVKFFGPDGLSRSPPKFVTDRLSAEST